MFILFLYCDCSETLRGMSSRGWLKSTLFAQGLKKSSDKSSNLLLDLTAPPTGLGAKLREDTGQGSRVDFGSEFGSFTPADLLIQWLCLHDTTHQNFKVLTCIYKQDFYS